MPENGRFGWLLLMVGLSLVLTGLLWVFGPSIPWLGRLPGDIRVEGPRVRLYVPLMTCLLLSVALSLVLWVVGRLRG